jgi:hypothetical protein
MCNALESARPGQADSSSTLTLSEHGKSYSDLPVRKAVIAAAQTRPERRCPGWSIKTNERKKEKGIKSRAYERFCQFIVQKGRME